MRNALLTLSLLALAVPSLAGEADRLAIERNGEAATELLRATAADPRQGAAVLIRVWAASQPGDTRLGKRAHRILRDEESAERVRAAIERLLTEPDDDHYAAIRILDDLASPQAAQVLLGMLPAVDEDGVTLTSDQVPSETVEYAVMKLVTFCDAGSLPRLRAVIDAIARDPMRGESAARMFERELKSREEAE